MDSRCKVRDCPRYAWERYSGKSKVRCCKMFISLASRAADFEDFYLLVEDALHNVGKQVNEKKSRELLPLILKSLVFKKHSDSWTIYACCWSEEERKAKGWSKMKEKMDWQTYQEKEEKLKQEEKEQACTTWRMWKSCTGISRIWINS